MTHFLLRGASGVLGTQWTQIFCEHFFFEGKDDEQAPAGVTTSIAAGAAGATGDGPDPSDPADAGRKCAPFWPTVAVIEFTDIAFAVDSILAAIALVGPPPPDDDPTQRTHPKLWVVVTGGMLGVILMRFAAVLFIRLLDRFPRFETSALKTRPVSVRAGVSAMRLMTMRFAFVALL